MDNQRINKILKELDEMIRDAQPRSKFRVEEPGYLLSLSANRSGLISLAREFLSAAVSKPASKPFILDGAHDQLHESEEDLVLGQIWHEQELPVPESELANRLNKQERRDFFALIGCGIISFVFLMILVGGCIFWFKSFFGEV